MSTSLQRKAEKLVQLLERLAAEATQSNLILVEGQSDIEALRKLAIQGNIISVKTAGKSFLDVVTEVERQNISKVILLLDFDRRGIEWEKRLKKRLEEKRIKADINFWNKMRALVGHDVKDVEGLPSYVKTLKKRIGD